ncbi:putative GPI-anchored cell surface glycoprotein [Aspergillus clavatus NRRL 1]|uniref:GPI-anchored cell surface glycoprotein, putative n=1 Tax=Aspergillus clavatus (strain ATCC 1007 / CBS 513.65 / DSM 816 / NCTC 3887 / NRRL 1 / QM 1276 / 107) TaxID=344612 RepID=A1CHH7_ASPCL|nr:GPI-anchored cell surface glycoprotein, putative [Aspergillus clavatus NRRL 1]EAW10332.1 GPI-anchored cell surface glycoprotein, putative [Aspergillus clavatus NRRL 1]
MAQTSYSLPPTPLASSFDESLSSTKRCHSQHPPGDLKTPQPGKTKNSTQKRDSIAPEVKSEVKKSNHKKPGQPNSHNQDSQKHELATPISNSKRKAKAPQSQSNLRTLLLKDPQKKRKSLSTTTELLGKHKNKLKSKSSIVASTPMQNSRKARKSMPATLNNATEHKKEATSAKPSKASASRASTPARSHHKSKTASQASMKACKPATNSMDHSIPQPTPSITTKKGIGATESATAAVKASAPARDSTAKSRRRRDRKSAAAMRKIIDSAQQTPSHTTPLPGPTNDAAEPLSHTLNTRSSRAKAAAAKMLNVDKALDSPVPLMALNATPRNREVADSVDGTPMQVYSDGFHFDYAPEMYGNAFGLDGQVDSSGSPTSLSTGASAAARASTRVRKPTIRALESLESERQFRRSRPPSSKADSTSGEVMGQRKGDVAQQAPPTTQTSHVPSAAEQPDTATIARQLFDFAAAAVSAEDPALDAGLEAKMESLRQEFEAENLSQIRQEAGSGGESRLTSSLPYILDNRKVSEPWTDEDGWTHTGLLNKFGEEYVFVSSDYEWVHPANTYGDDQLPQPPGRFRTREQAEKDRVFGYPPRLGERNLPRQTSFFRFENVDEEKAKVRARDAARLRGIPVDRTMSVADIEALITQHDSTGQKEISKEVEKPVGSTRKRRRTEPAKDSSETSSGSKRRRTNPPAIAATAVAAAAEKPTLKIKFRFSNPEKAAAVAAIIAGADQPTSLSKKRRFSDTNGAMAATESPKKCKPSPEPASPANQALALTPSGRPRRRAAAALMADFQSHAEERASRAQARKSAVGISGKPGEAQVQLEEGLKSV